MVRRFLSRGMGEASCQTLNEMGVFMNKWREDGKVERLSYVDVAKALGIIAVMFAHGCGFPGNMGYFFTASFMQMFFFLSGYTYKSGRIATENIKHRFKAIGIPYFIYNAILLVLSFAAYKVLHKEVSGNFWLIAVSGIFYSSSHLYYPDSVVPNISFFNIQNAALWYLTCFLVASTIFYLIIDKITNKKRYLLSIAMLTFITIGLKDIPIRLPWSMDTAFAGTVFMLLGYSVRKTELLKKLEKWYWVGGILICYLLCCSINPGIGMSLRKYGPYGTWSVLMFVVIGYLGSLLYIFGAKLLCRLPGITLVLSYIGKKTLVLLGFHNFIFLVWDKFAERLGLFQNAYGLYGIAQVAVTLAVCLCLSSPLSHKYNPNSHKKNLDISR